MAATRTAYLNNGNAITMDEQDFAGAVINSYDAYIAAYIYGSSDILSLFYLDAISEVQMTDDAETTVLGTGFIGLVKPGGFNYNHHASSRLFKGVLPVYDDAGNLITDHVALNDGGLNTKGGVDSLVVTQNANGINAVATFRTAFYEGLAKSGFTTTHFNGSNNSGGFVTVQRNGGTATLTRRLNYLFQKGDTFSIDASIGGDEGDYTTPAQSIFVTRLDCFVISARIITASGAPVPTGSILFSGTGGVLDSTYHDSQRVEWSSNGTAEVDVSLYIENGGAVGNADGTVSLQITGAFFQGTWVLLGTNYGDTYTFEKNLTIYIKLTNY